MRHAAGRAFKRKKLGQSAKPCRSSDQPHRLRALRAARRHRRGLAHAFVGQPNILDVCQHVAVSVSSAAPPTRAGSLAYVEKIGATKNRRCRIRTVIERGALLRSGSKINLRKSK